MRLRLVHDILPGPYTFAGKEGLFKVHTYEQEIGGKANTKPFAKKLWLTKHGTVHVSMSFNNLLPQVFPTMVRMGQYSQKTIRRILFYFPEPQEGGKGEVIGLRFLLEPVKLEYIKMWMPNVKDEQYERYGHELFFGFRYKYLTVTRPKGNLQAGPYLSHHFFDDADGASPEDWEEFENLLYHGPAAEAVRQVNAWKESQKPKAQAQTAAKQNGVTVNFLDEDEGAFSGLKVQLASGEEAEASNGKAKMPTKSEKAGLAFNDIAMNYQPGNMLTFA
jgi:hypothetical protein